MCLRIGLLRHFGSKRRGQKYSILFSMLQQIYELYYLFYVCEKGIFFAMTILCERYLRDVPYHNYSTCTLKC